MIGFYTDTYMIQILEIDSLVTPYPTLFYSTLPDPRLPYPTYPALLNLILPYHNLPAYLILPYTLTCGTLTYPTLP